MPSASRETTSPLRPRCRCLTAATLVQRALPSGPVRLALNLGYWDARGGRDDVALAQEAERLGFAVV